MRTPLPDIRRSGIARFGAFEVDLDTRELRKDGERVRIQDQPFSVLAVLLERSGEIVTREVFRQKLWPADTFVDFDHSLNTAVNKIRETLGDSASAPRFVETVAKRGYRFLAPVRWEDDSKQKLSPAVPQGLPSASRGITRTLFALIQVMYLAFYAEALFHWQGVERISWAGGTNVILILVLVTAGIGIPVRCYFFSATAFDYALLGDKFRKMFIPVLLLDELWAMAPFLILDQIGFGAAFAATAALLYVPFAERTLIRMSYPQSSQA